MSEGFVRHLISLVGTLVGLVIYSAGYIGGKNGWWWAAFGIIILYVIIYKLIDA